VPNIFGQGCTSLYTYIWNRPFLSTLHWFHWFSSCERFHFKE